MVATQFCHRIIETSTAICCHLYQLNILSVSLVTTALPYCGVNLFNSRMLMTTYAICLSVPDSLHSIQCPPVLSWCSKSQNFYEWIIFVRSICSWELDTTSWLLWIAPQEAWYCTCLQLLISFPLDVDPRSGIAGSCGFVIYFYFQVQSSGHPDFPSGRTDLHASTVCGRPSLWLLPVFIIGFKWKSF